MNDPDRTLVNRAHQGDQRAMEALYKKHVPMVHAYALRATGRHEVADEVVQETFIRAFKALGRFSGRSTFKTWLFSIAINCVRTQLKKAGRVQEVALDDTHEQVEQVDAKEASAFMQKRLSQALAMLPEGYREVVIMHDVLQMEHQEIADVRKCSVGTSKSQLHKARAKLRALLQPVLGDQNART